jgi:hypothetical protein
MGARLPWPQYDEAQPNLATRCHKLPMLFLAPPPVRGPRRIAVSEIDYAVDILYVRLR